MQVKVKDLGVKPNIKNDPDFILKSTYGTMFPPELIMNGYSPEVSVYSDSYMLGHITFALFNIETKSTDHFEKG